MNVEFQFSKNSHIFEIDNHNNRIVQKSIISGKKKSKQLYRSLESSLIDTGYDNKYICDKCRKYRIV